MYGTNAIHKLRSDQWRSGEAIGLVLQADRSSSATRWRPTRSCCASRPTRGSRSCSRRRSCRCSVATRATRRGVRGDAPRNAGHAPDRPLPADRGRGARALPPTCRLGSLRRDRRSHWSPRAPPAAGRRSLCVGFEPGSPPNSPTRCLEAARTSERRASATARRRPPAGSVDPRVGSGVRSRRVLHAPARDHARPGVDVERRGSRLHVGARAGRRGAGGRRRRPELAAVRADPDPDDSLVRRRGLHDAVPRGRPAPPPLGGRLRQAAEPRGHLRIRALAQVLLARLRRRLRGALSYVANYLCQQWNATHDSALDTVTLYYLYERHDPYAGSSSENRELLVEYDWGGDLVQY